MYLIFDSETEIHKSRKRTANPFDDRNYVVARGWKREGDDRCSAEFFKGKTPDNYLRIGPEIKILVGHNIKFDLLYEMCNNNPDLRAFFKRGGRIWCTQYAKYLLANQERKYHMNSMDQIIEEYGGRKKIDGMKALWEKGVQTSDIDPAMVLDYLIGTEEEGRDSGDIGNTEKIFLGQLEEAKGLSMMSMMKCRMDGLCATTEMEFNGIHVNTKVAKEDFVRLSEELVEAEKKLATYVTQLPEGLDFNWGSGTHKSVIIFGGTIKYSKPANYLDEKTGELARLKATEKWPLFDGHPVRIDKDLYDSTDEAGVITYYKKQLDSDEPIYQDCFLSGKKKGEPKFRNVPVQGELKSRLTDFFHPLPGYVDGKKWEIKRGKNTDGAGVPLFSTDSGTVEILGNLDVPFLKDLAKKTKLDKEIGTYYAKKDPKTGEIKGMLTCVDPKTHIVHHMLNHSSTVTTRLSSSSPNCQNIPTGKASRVKAMFTSRFSDGIVGELDYSQLEVVVLGLLSGDKNLIRDLLAGVDFHCKRVAMREGCTYEEALQWCKDEDDPKYPVWSQYRQECKIFSFQRAYGAGAATIALTAGMTKEAVETMIKQEEIMYPDVAKFHEKVEKEINATATTFADRERGFRPFRKGTWQAPTGTIYGWRSWDAPKFMRDKGITDTFSPPEIKNYPTQGTGGELVQMVLGYLWRWFTKNDNFGGKAFLVNTVHDCVWVDMKPEVVDEVISGMKQIMTAIPAMLKKNFDWDCPVPFPVDAEIGNDMLKMRHWVAS